MPKSDSLPKQSGTDNGVIRLLLLGDSAVGKSSLLLRFCEGRFENNFVITIGVDFKTKTMNIDGKQHRVQVWDTAGQERFRTITPAYYRNAMGVLILFDVTNKKSFDSMLYIPLLTVMSRCGLLGSES
jgi:small GTP-binding protein